ncbi:MAG TPA: carboxypeptidase regulatory-like domain-containing protein [Vicinamibacterales bacterium]|nr:carboxypeptidase regulatory-like domain-containing protein [Vicinamibacterales bacterium]
MRRRRAWLAIAALTALVAWLVPAAAYAQAVGSIAGVVTDESGAILPGVTVDATNTATGQVRTTVTGADGYYTVPQLQPGNYTVKATLSGFRPVMREGTVVSVGDTSRVDLKLSVGGVEESVTVSAEAPLVETSHATLGITIDQQKVVELPLNGRNFTQLGTLIPGVVAPPSGLGGQAGDATPGGFGASTAGFNVNGMRNQSNSFLLDGTTNNDTFNTGFVLRPPPDAIQEFKIQTHSYAAEFGRNAGAVVNVVTKSGSNEFHGAGWEFNRNDSLQARNYFAPKDQAKPKLKQNQFGATFGGPIQHNKLFFFGYYEGYRNQQGSTSNVVVLSDAQRAGNFGSTKIIDPSTGLPFPNNTIPANQLDPSALKLINDFVPHANSGANRYVVSPTTTDNRDSFGLRMDYHLSSSNSILGRYLRTHTDRVTPPITTPVAQESKATLQDTMLSDTQLFGNNKINVARFASNRIFANPAVTSGLDNSAYGINVPNTNALAQGLASITVSGFFTLGDSQQPFVQRVNQVYEGSDDFTWIRGKHQMKFGVDVQHTHMVIAFINRPNGDFTFSGGFTGNAAADFMLGLPFQFRRTTKNQAQDGTETTFAAYAQDEFRPWSRITLDYGVRYEVTPPFVDKNNALNAFHPGVQSVVFPNAPEGLVYPGDPGVPRGTYATDKNNFAPRLGAVWDVNGNGRTTVRAAWGLFYDTLAGQGDFFQNGVLAPPFTPLLQIDTPAPMTLENPLTSATGGATDFPPGLTIIGWAEDFQSPYAYQYNLTLQRQVGDNIGIEAGYVGSLGRHMPIFMEVNPGVYTPGQTKPGARIFPAFALVRPTFSVAKSTYNSFQASARMRPVHGFNFLASYTYGRSYDNVSGLNIGGDARPALPVTIGDQASIDRSLAYEWGPSLFDVRHRFVASFGVELPTPHSMGAVAQHLLGGWEVNGIVQAQTGFPFTITDPLTDIRYMTNRPNMTCDPNDNAPHTTAEWFDTSCFQRRPVATTGSGPGSEPRNAVRGPGMSNTDLSLFRNIDVRQGQRIQLRLEMFNLFNQVHYNQPGNLIGTANFGVITSATDGRVVQLGIKYLF